MYGVGIKVPAAIIEYSMKSILDILNDFP